MMKTPYYSVDTLPWDRAAEEEKLFRKIFVAFLILFFLMALVIPNIPVPEKQRDHVEKVPPRLAKLVMEKRKPPPPPPPPPKEEKKEEEPKKEEPKKEEPKKEEPKKEEEKPKPTAKEKAKAAIAVFDDLSDLRDNDDLANLNAEQKDVSAMGAQESKTERNLVGSMALGSSGGVSTSKASSGGGGSGSLAGVKTTQVESKIADPAAEQASRRGKDGKSRRSTEDIQLVFDKHKGSIYGLYRRALRKNPALEGTVVLKMEIQPNGTVTQCSVVSSELDDEDLERKIMLKIKQINFGAMNVDVWNDTYPISFIPS
ncbi:AgmX/PglI C-terminal domain-containing protein [Ketobacter sp. MCCC 1A13808]|uniref:AgmX/PglI C-terminal domain-containing protein n=1 Tax=Ketobacter sp. MCCC 1A13808 TaxID=2602738 RepID=UPI0012EB8989|nr:AgmX/PglI C-terminal domain-containing protein [Ketobacter sp. MCCC 1A13808]MVF12647.1 AgmX/PglI C-terminal domain-containing protein [Ketobacter sp. MCCC 1A13808]